MTGGPSKSRGALEVILFEETRFRGSMMFTSAEVTVGSDPGVMVRLDDKNVSPCQAVLRFDGETCTIESWDGQPGTLVNGLPIEEHQVSPTDEIQLGRFRLRIAIHRANATPAPVSVRAPACPASPAPPPLPKRAPVSPAVVSLPVHVRTAVAPGPASTAAPTALAVAPAVTPVPKVEPPPRKKRTTLSSVPAEPHPDRSVPQPIVARHAEAAPSGEAIDVTTERATPCAPSPPVSELLGDDDDDDDGFFQPTFSLFERLRESGTKPHLASAVEVVRFRDGCILNLHHLRRGEKLRLHGMRRPLGRCSGAGGFVFRRDALPDTIAVSTRGQPVDDATWRLGADKRGRIALEPTTQVLFTLPSGEGVLVHLVPAAGPLPRSAWRPRLTKLMLAFAAVSVATHLVVFLVLGVASLVRRDYIAVNKEGRFARIALKEIELEPPAPPPKQEQKKEQERKKPKPEPQVANAEPTPRSAPRLPRTRTTIAPQTPQTPSAETAQKLLSALGGLSAGPKPLSATAISNINAVAPVHGGGFKVSGAIGKLPGDSLRLAAAGSGMGRLDTKSTNDVGKDLGRVLGHAPTGQVRAQVTSRPKMMKVEGHLDRGEIQKVINAHIHELQGCFERQLIVSPTLAGKVTFEWVIGGSGAVTVVKIKASSLSSSEATSCMQAAIRRWQFPAPSGGSVTVIYPIALANSGT